MRLRPALIVPLVALTAACSRPSDSSAQTSGGQTAAGAPSAAEAPLPAPHRTIPSDLSAVKLSFAPVVKRVAPAVVNISSKRVVRQQVDPFFELFGGGMGVPRERIEGSLGSGAIVRADGLIITNHHVIAGGQEITVSLADRREFPAKVLLDDARSDLAVLKIEARAEKLPVLPIADRADIQVGDLVLAVGDPFGVGQTVTNGIVSALSRTGLSGDAGDFSNYIQTDAAVNPGNSGGPLVDMAGDLIGVNTLILSRSGSNSGVSLAIPAPLVRRVVETAVGGGRAVSRPWIGAQFQSVDADTARSLGLDRPEGVVVSNVYPSGPADRAGLKAGDVVTAADGAPANDPGALNYAAATHQAGDVETLTVRRAGAIRSVPVRLEKPPATPARDERALAGRQPLSGATVVNLSPAVADQYGLDPFAKGVMITKVTGIAAQQGFRPGDVVRALNGQPVGSTAGLQAALQAGRWRIELDRGGQRVIAEF